MALGVILYKNSSEVPSNEIFLDGKANVICPGPVVADNFRKKLAQVGLQNDVITIAKFVKDSLTSIPEFEIENFQRKSQLMLELATAWKLYFTDTTPEIFFQAFNLFTEFRSYSLNLNLMEEIFQYYEEEVVKSIKLFWLLTNERGIVDEHKSYELISQFGSEVFEEGKSLVFWGFPHMSGLQVDMIKSLSRLCDIYILFPERVFHHSTSSDWIRWLKEEGPEGEVRAHGRAKIAYYQKNRLGDALNFLKENESIKNTDFYLMTKSPSFNEINEINLQDGYFKTSVSLFEEKTSKIFSKLNSLKFPVDVSSFMEIINHEIDSCLKATQDFVLLKVLTTLRELIEKWESLSETNTLVSYFELEVFRQCLELDLPRVFGIPISGAENGQNIYGIEGLDSYDGSKGGIIVASSAYAPMRGGGEKFINEVSTILTSIGPMRRKDIDFYMIKENLMEVLAHSNSVLLIESGLDDHDLSWSDVVLNLEEKSIVDIESKGGELNFKDVLTLGDPQVQAVTTFSATKLQNYIDCPRKYYLNYIKKVQSVDKLETSLLPSHLGTIQHLVVQKTFEEKRKTDFEGVSETSRELFNKFLASRNVQLEKIEYSKYLAEIINYSFNGVSFLDSFVKNYPNGNFEFEFDISRTDPSYKGFIDCLFRGDGFCFLLDFKRSAGSVPKEKEILENKKIQLWYYLKNGPISIDEVSLLGFISLADISESLLYYIPNEKTLILDEILDVKLKTPKFDFKEVLSTYISFEKDLIEKMNNDRKFLPLPAGANVCTFCEVKNLCPKMELER